MHQRRAASSRLATRRHTWSMRRSSSIRDPSLASDWIQYPPAAGLVKRVALPPQTPAEPPGRAGMSDQSERRRRGLERLRELGDEPGGDAFLERMGSPM